MAGVFESERDDIAALGDSLKWIDSTEDPQNVIMALLRVVSSCLDSPASSSSIASLSVRFDCSISTVRRSIYSLLAMRNSVCRSQVSYEDISNSLLTFGLSAPLSNAVGEYVKSLQEKPCTEPSVCLSQYPSLTSVAARIEINIGTMALRYSPSVMVRIRFVIGECEKIVVVDAVTLQHCCQQIQNCLSSILKL